MGSLNPGSHKKASDPSGIPIGSHADPTQLLRQPAALIGDQLLDAGEKSFTQPLHIEGVVDTIAHPLQAGSECLTVHAGPLHGG